MVPLIPVITSVLASIGEKKIPGTKRSISEFTNKTNGWASTVIGFSVYQLSQNPENDTYIFLIVFCGFMVTIRDTATKVMNALDKRS